MFTNACLRGKSANDQPEDSRNFNLVQNKTVAFDLRPPVVLFGFRYFLDA